MKTIILAAAAALMLNTGTALAGEGEGEPFPFRAPGLTTSVNPAVHANTASEPYPDLAGYPTQIEAAINPDLVPPNSSEGIIQTAASLPRGFSDGMVAYAQVQSVRRYLAQRIRRATDTAQRLEVPERLVMTGSGVSR